MRRRMYLKPYVCQWTFTVYLTCSKICNLSSTEINGTLSAWYKSRSSRARIVFGVSTDTIPYFLTAHFLEDDIYICCDSSILHATHFRTRHFSIKRIHTASSNLTIFRSLFSSLAAIFSLSIFCINAAS